MARIDVAAYYFPNYHRDARNEAWHGRGWTEWELVKAARPRYEGHRQPIVPAWGCFDESDPQWAAREIDLAADHGVSTFIYDWYWYEDGPYLQDALERGFLRAPNRERMRFALMWANHDWTNIHPASFTNKPETLAPGALSRAAFERMTDHIVATYLSQPNYLTIDGCPYFSIYELGTFIRGMGGVDGAAQAIESFRAKVRAAGFRDLHLNGVVWGVNVLPSESKLPGESRREVIDRLGFASVTTYAWVHHFNPSGSGFPKSSYAAAMEANVAAWSRYRTEFPMPYHPNVSMGWDPSPRTIQSDTYENRGYPFTGILEGNTPAAFRSALEKARDFIGAGPDQHTLVTLNAWNEWTEGSYLLPDNHHGNAYLEAVRATFGDSRARSATSG
ncbi:MAG: glycoside hydrolase family 99-like domain-containing protein [Planctomycetes bacterium]|nr:glycoside hydrolase family 99-like domain-containing protein [Planctomycetota bacterium]